MDVKDTFALEKYKYVLLRKQALNEATFKIAAIYQALVIGVGVAQYSVLASHQTRTIDDKLALQASICLMIMLMVTTALILSLLIGGIFAWVKYREDESSISEEYLNKARDPIKLRSIFSWYETYLALVVLIVAVLGVLGYTLYLLPSLLMGIP
ncbi:hypothetical protein [Pseudomonas frederiksbergensis]|uniref:hypothetical protein n=1 Tax=Pseudomonas frederiksbergensis TaxID=104087 RepID=UPI003D1E868C